MNKLSDIKLALSYITTNTLILKFCIDLFRVPDTLVLAL